MAVHDVLCKLCVSHLHGFDNPEVILKAGKVDVRGLFGETGIGALFKRTDDRADKVRKQRVSG